MGSGETSPFEPWIEEQVVAWLSDSSGAGRATIEEFVATRTPPPGSEGRARERLFERLRIVAGFELDLRSVGAATIEPGRIVGDFEILELLGRGGMGQVFRARQTSLGREVAIKVPHWAEALDPKGRARFVREAQAVAQLRHPGIVQLHQVGEHAGTPYLVLELVHGRSLAAIVRDVAAGRLARTAASLGRNQGSWEEAASALILDALDALAAAHEAGISHRDLKPSNLLVEPGGRVRVLDFGLARFENASEITGSAERVGTLGYLAPETIHNPQASGPWSDLYALGVTLYELLALERPFEGATPSATLARIERGDATPLHVRRRAPRRLSAIVEKAMAREIEARYGSAKDFSGDLRAFLDGGDILARPSTVWSRVGRRMQRNPAMTLIGTLLVIAIGLFAGAWRSSQEANARIDRENARILTRGAYLWPFADDTLQGATGSPIEGKLRAIEDFRAALRLDPTLVEARVGLARLCVQASQPSEAREHIRRLRSDGVHDRVIDWIEAWLEDPDRKGAHPDVGESLDADRASALDRLAWATSLLSRDPCDLERVAEVLRPVETDELLGPVAQYLQFQASYTRGVRDYARASRYLHGVGMLVHEHPIVLSNLATVLLDRFRSLEQGPGEVADDWKAERARLAGDLASAVATLQRIGVAWPSVRPLWVSHVAVLGSLGRYDEARTVLMHGLEHLPDDPWLVNLLAQTYFTAWTPIIDQGQVPPPEELEQIYSMLERTVAREDGLPINLVNIARVGYYADEPAIACPWVARLESEAMPKLDPPMRARMKPVVDGMIDWCRRRFVEPLENATPSAELPATAPR